MIMNEQQEQNSELILIQINLISLQYQMLYLEI
jgi:hypothetical protein